MFLLYVTKIFYDEWDDGEYENTEIIGLYRTFTKPLKKAREQRQRFVDKLVLQNALDEAKYWDSETCNRIFEVGPIFEESEYSNIDNDDFRSYLYIKSRFCVKMIDGEYEYIYQIREIEMTD